MREIKFRAWDKNNRAMVYSDDNPKDEFAFIVENEGLQFYYIDTDRHLMDTYSIIMQYTGLKDKNGTEIYEGDILRLLNSGVLCEVVYDAPSFCRKWLSPKVSSFRGVELESMAHNTHIVYEVIGNIYEHRHLLKR